MCCNKDERRKGGKNKVLTTMLQQICCNTEKRRKGMTAATNGTNAVVSSIPLSHQNKAASVTFLQNFSLV
jgi:hypothetical protein